MTNPCLSWYLTNMAQGEGGGWLVVPATKADLHTLSSDLHVHLPPLQIKSN